MAVAMSLPDHEVGQGDGDADDREHDVVPQHQGRVEKGRDEPDHARGEVARQDGGHRLVAGNPVAHLARVALGEELNRQPQHVPQEPSGRRNRELGLGPHEEVLLQSREPCPQHGRHPHTHQQRPQPALGPADEDLVDEDLGEGRDRQSGDDQTEPGQHTERHRDANAAGPPLEGPDHAGSLAAALELGARLERQHHAGEGLVELLVGDGAPAVRGVVEVHAIAADRLQD
jgi:hypothetical protein